MAVGERAAEVRAAVARGGVVRVVEERAAVG